ncbi:uncharacterized protein LOC132498418 isoform X2 [Mesoplodon densirostris]|uniref:uncharacterized protein LOC132498418 isoform X2 n=1 Tax=Mesoplodon densirostris TaxID=48708 RepID=UPI0028DC8EF0|nr:uncharacterized protein LOC132498418 isoform X2 [Mesoplodon densirostris]
MSIGDERGRIADRARRGRGPLPGPRRPPTPSSSKSSSSSAAAPRPPAAECNREVESLCQRASLSSVGAQEQSGASHPWVPPKTPEGVEKRGTITRRTDSEPGTCGKTFKGFEKTLAMPLINWELCENFKIIHAWTSLVVQWLRIRLPMKGTRVRALVQEDPTCHGATKPMRHNY